MAYATAAEYLAYIDPGTISDQDEVERLLDRASELIDELLIGAWYPVDVNGLPTEQEHIDALSDATCAQVSWFEETGDDQGAVSRYSAVKIGDVSLNRNTVGGQVTSRVAPHVLTLLRRAKLLPINPIVVG